MIVSPRKVGRLPSKLERIMMTDRRKGRTKPMKSTRSMSTHPPTKDTNIRPKDPSFEAGDTSTTPHRPASLTKIDLRKEYNRFCKLYSSEPLDIIAGPLEKSSFSIDSVELNLKGRGLRGVDCIALGKILANNATIYHLNLNDCLLLPQGFQVLLDGLGRNTHLQILELRGNNIQSTMIDNLSTFLKLNHTIKQLLLEWNCLGTSKSKFQSFCDALSINKSLQLVDLRNNQITDESGIEIASALKNNLMLKTIDLRWNSIGIQGAKAIWDALQFNKKITKIELSGNIVPEEIVRHIRTTLDQRNEQEQIIEDYSKRTHLLTRQLQKTEDEHKSEIMSMVTVFGDEEAEFQRMIKEGQDEIKRLKQELVEERTSKEVQQKIIMVELNEMRTSFTKMHENLLKKTSEGDRLAKELSEIKIMLEIQSKQTELAETSLNHERERGLSQFKEIEQLKQVLGENATTIEKLREQNKVVESETQNEREWLLRHRSDMDASETQLQNIEGICGEMGDKIGELVTIQDKLKKTFSVKTK